MKKKILWISSLLIATGVVLAQVPNTFKAGDRLSADKINDNFTHLSKVVKDGTGKILGQLIGVSQSEIYVMTNSGYRYGIDAVGNIKIPMGSMNIPSQATCGFQTTSCFYTDANCSTPAPSNSIFIAGIMPGMVMQVPPALYYLDKGTVTVPFILYQYSGTPTCNVQLTSQTGYIATPNNPALTGVSASLYTLPITITNQ